MLLPSIAELADKAKIAFKRFPITLVWAIVGTFFCIFLLEDTTAERLEENTDILMTLILGVSWLIGIQFFVEQLKVQKIWGWLKLVILGLLFAFFWYMPSNGNELDDNIEFLIRFALFFIAGHLFVLFAPFALKWDKSAYWNYLKTMGTAIGRSLIFSGVLYLGLVLALAAIDALFEVQIRGERYGQLFVFCLGIVNTLIYLSDFPQNVHENKDIQFHRALEVFVKYILIPLVVLYLVILYSYGFKILLEWELPKGWVSYLVTALALLGFVVQVVVNPVQQTIKSWAINKFYPWFYILLLPLILLLFVAIFRRISDYGVTENRYFVVLLAFWILGISLYLLLAKKTRLILLPISIFILALFSAIGPWGALPVSKNSQINRFEKVLTAVRVNENMATVDQHEQLRSILNYLDERRALLKLEPIIGIAMRSAFKDSVDGELKAYVGLDTEKVLNALGVTISAKELSKIRPNGEYYIYNGNQNSIHNYDIKEFHYFAPITFKSINHAPLEIGEYDIRFNAEEVKLSFIHKRDISMTLELAMMEILIGLTEHGPDLSKLNEEQLTLQNQNNKILVKLIFTDLGFNSKKDSISINHASALLFLREK